MYLQYNTSPSYKYCTIHGRTSRNGTIKPPGCLWLVSVKVLEGSVSPCLWWTILPLPNDAMIDDTCSSMCALSLAAPPPLPPPKKTVRYIPRYILWPASSHRTISPLPLPCLFDPLDWPGLLAYLVSLALRNWDEPGNRRNGLKE